MKMFIGFLSLVGIFGTIVFNLTGNCTMGINVIILYLCIVILSK